MKNRIFGLETEYGLLINSDDPTQSPSWLARRLIDHIFNTKHHGVLDQHHRGYDEPPGNGGFLRNAGRLYVDMGHIEFATPECHTLADLVASDRGGDQLIQQALNELGLQDTVSFIKNNIDHQTDATFGSHENYLVTRDFPFHLQGLNTLIPFLVTRQIFTGAGRIGVTETPDGWIPLELLMEDRVQPDAHIDADVPPFQISQRSDHIVNDFFEWVQHNRAIINTRDEPLADPSKFRRIHLLLGDSNLAEFATALKMGTTGLVMQLIEDGCVPKGLELDDPVQALRDVSRDPERKWLVTSALGKTLSASDVQEQYLRAAQDEYRGQDEETDWVLEQWEAVLSDLQRGYEKVVGRVDWASKLWLLESFRDSEKLAWSDPWLRSLDLEYHNVNPSTGLYFGLQEGGQAPRLTTDAAVDVAMHNPPRNTRAFGRGELVKHLLKHSSAGGSGYDSESDARQAEYVINWSIFQVRGHAPFPMVDPFKTYASEVQRHLAKEAGVVPDVS
ncbi:MAG TPA: hypothetical protein EYM83_01390 [Nitrospirales bacterium]|nr:hypothetical protein [Nitrospirales bacterium]